MVDSTIARGGETPWLGGACVWQAGSWGAQPKVIVQSVGAKGERVHYLSRQLLPTGPLAMSQQQSQMVLIANREFSHLGLLDFESERDVAELV